MLRNKNCAKRRLVCHQNPDMLDDFVRTQSVERIYRKKGSDYEIVPFHFIMDWDIRKKREVARELLQDEFISFVALCEGKIVGLLSLKKELIEDKMILDIIQVSSSYRRNGIGKQLFEIAKTYALEFGAKELYISAFPGEKTVAFYLSMGAEITKRPIVSIAEAEPEDVQMTLALLPKTIA